MLPLLNESQSHLAVEPQAETLQNIADKKNNKYTKGGPPQLKIQSYNILIDCDTFYDYLNGHLDLPNLKM